MRRVHATITGTVQGVGFRYSAWARARELGLAGWVRNFADGSVEVEAGGESGARERMLAWMDRGPRGARVAAVAVTEVPVAYAMEFTIER